MPAVKRMLSVSTNPTGLASAVAALYAAGIMIYHAAHHAGVIDPQVIVAALAAAAFLYTRFLVTPVADPKDGNGAPLAPSVPVISPVPAVPPVPPA